MKAYITRYALTQGILEAEGHSLLGTFCAREASGDHRYFQRNEWHLTEENAIAAAEGMRDAKIASLRKKIENLEKMTFEEPKS